MAGLSDTFENRALDWLTAIGTPSRPSATYVGLLTATPTDSTGGTEVAGNAYARQAVTFGAASGGATSNSNLVTFPDASGAWGTITHFGIYDASSAGNLIWYGALGASKVIASGDAFQFAIASLTVSLD